MSRARALFILSLVCLLSLAALAQEGHPLTGSWHGEWHPAPNQKTPVLFYMKWNAKEVEGMINPGPNSMPLKVVTLDPAKNPAAGYLRGTFDWHLDGATDDIPIMATVLSARAVAASGGVGMK